jgi:hypothetical protein
VIARIATRAAIFAAISFALQLGLAALRGMVIDGAVIASALTVTAFGALAYVGVSALIAWVRA